MLWWESVEEALTNLGGAAPLRDLYAEVRKVRTRDGDTIPQSLDAVVRRELEYNSSDSTQWKKKRDIFFSVHGKGEGVWGLRVEMAPAPEAVDLSEPEIVGPAPVEQITINRILRDTAMSRKVKALHHGHCQICGQTIKLPDGRPYAEGHHLIPLGKPHLGPDISANIIVVCPNHHAMLDMGCISLDLDKLATAAGHTISPQSIIYHNDVVVKDTSGSNGS